MTIQDTASSTDQTTIDAATIDASGGADAAPVAAAPHGYITGKAKYLARLRRIEGQARGIHRMVDEEQYCIDILTQIAAINSALENVALALIAALMQLTPATAPHPSAMLHIAAAEQPPQPVTVPPRPRSLLELSISRT